MTNRGESHGNDGKNGNDENHKSHPSHKSHQRVNPDPDRLLPPRGDYQTLLSFQKAEGVGQAKDDAGKLAIRWAYSTNGQGIYQVDMGAGAAVDGKNGIDVNDAIQKSHDSYKSHPLETEVRQFPTPEHPRTSPNIREPTRIPVN